MSTPYNAEYKVWQRFYREKSKGEPKNYFRPGDQSFFTSAFMSQTTAKRSRIRQKV